MMKPDGLVVIRPVDLPHKLHTLELRDLYGIGARMEARLRAHAIDTVEQLCATSKEMLRAIWGGIEGERFHAKLHGQHTEPRETERRTLSHSHILPPELRNESGARSVLHRLAQKAAMRLRSLGCVTEAMSVFIKARGQTSEWTGELRFAPTQDTLELLHALDLLWQKRSLSHAAAPFAVGVAFFGLKDEKNDMFSLLDRPAQDRRRALLQAMDKLNIKWG